MLKTSDSRRGVVWAVILLVAFHVIVLFSMSGQHNNADTWNKYHKAKAAAHPHVYYDYFTCWWHGLVWAGGIAATLFAVGWACVGFVLLCEKVDAWVHNAPADKTARIVEDMSTIKNEDCVYAQSW